MIGTPHNNTIMHTCTLARACETHEGTNGHTSVFCRHFPLCDLAGLTQAGHAGHLENLKLMFFFVAGS